MNGGSRNGPRTVVLYDVDCGFCRWSMAKLLVWDRNQRLRPVAIGSPDGQRLLAALSAAEREASWHLIGPDGRCHSAAAAAAPLLRELPGGGGPAGLLERMPGLTERIYDWVASHRGRFTRLLPAGAKRRADERIRRREA